MSAASAPVTLWMEWQRGKNAHYGSNFVYLHTPCQDSEPCECNMSFKATNSSEFAGYISSFGENKVPVVYDVVYGADGRAITNQLVSVGTWRSERFAHNDRLISVSVKFQGGLVGERQSFKLRGSEDCFPSLNQPDANSNSGGTPSVQAAEVPDRSVGQERHQEQKQHNWLTISRKDAENLLTKRVEPEYPQDALEHRIQGSVLLTVLINETGNVIGVSPVSGHPLLLPAASEAVKQWAYRPYLKNGSAVPVQAEVRVDFRLPPR